MTSQNSSLTDLGWRPFFANQLSTDEAERCIPVRIMAVYRGLITIAGDGPDRLIASRIPNANDMEDHPASGDWLLIERETSQPVRILRRINLFKRRAANNARKLQLIAANVDNLFIVSSCNQDFNIARLERYLVLAREVGVNPIVVLTKSDLTDMPDTFVEAARGLQPDLRVEIVNARDANSVSRLAAWCGKGETVALLGSSGVGKSTLINSLRGSDSIATQAIREDDGMGRHTTTVREMHRLEQGGWLLDTPGMRELQLADTASGLADVFDDITLLQQSCRFSNCRHDAEPGCAIRSALEEGTLSLERLARWRKLAAENIG